MSSSISMSPKGNKHSTYLPKKGKTSSISLSPEGKENSTLVPKKRGRGRPRKIPRNDTNVGDNEITLRSEVGANSPVKKTFRRSPRERRSTDFYSRLSTPHHPKSLERSSTMPPFMPEMAPLPASAYNGGSADNARERTSPCAGVHILPSQSTTTSWAPACLAGRKIFSSMRGPPSPCTSPSNSATPHVDNNDTLGAPVSAVREASPTSVGSGVVEEQNKKTVPGSVLSDQSPFVPVSDVFHRETLGHR